MKSLLRVFKFLILIAALAGTNQAKATHTMGDDLTYVRIGLNQHSFITKQFQECDKILLNKAITIDIKSANYGNFSVQLSNFDGITNSYIPPLCHIKRNFYVEIH